MRSFFIVLGLLGLSAAGVYNAYSCDDDYAESIEDEVAKAESVVEEIAVDVYDFLLTLKVPQVFDNAESLGYRKMRKQTIRGEMFIVWKSDGNCDIRFANMANRNFKVGNSRVWYEGREISAAIMPRFVWIGSNRKNVFLTPCLSFHLELLPSYALGDADEDNSFNLFVAGSGVARMKNGWGGPIATRLSGHVAGNQGCGCRAHGAKSPTRTAGLHGPTSEITDVVPTAGTWKAVWRRRIEL